MIQLVEKINAFIWGVPALVCILGVGIYLSIRTGFLQIRLLPKALMHFCSSFRKHSGTSGVSSYRAVCTALAATVGTGNLAGVAGAICIGGPGAIFWMWLCGLLGMMLKFAEVTLAVCYRRKNDHGEWIGGPMYMICDGMGKQYQWMAGVYCFFGVVAAFGVGNATQINTVVGSVNAVLQNYGIVQSHLMNGAMGVVMALLICAMLRGGASRIGSAAEKLVPFASLLYILLGIGVLVLRYDQIPAAFSKIISGAFSPQAVTGGAVGSAFVGLRVGASRGVFTNEAGMGTASIAHAGANVTSATEQGLMGIVEVFLDTIVICTVTALVILCSGVPIGYGVDAGIQLTTRAFTGIYGDWVGILIAVALCCFAFATVLGWGLYGGRCAQYLFGDGVWKIFVWIQGIFVVIGAVMNNGVLWMLSETVNGLMAIPNLIAIFALSPVLIKTIKTSMHR